MSLKFDFDLNTALKRENVSLEILSHLRKGLEGDVAQWISDHQLLLFYMAFEQNIEKTRKAIKNYAKMKRNNSIYFHYRDPTQFFFLPVTPQKMSLVYGGLSTSDTSKFCFDTTIKTVLMVIDSCLNAQGPRNGLILIYDAKNFNFGHIRRITLSSIIFLCEYTQKCLPCKLKEIHLINCEWYLEAISTIFKPFLDNGWKLLFHRPTTDYQNLFNGNIPQNCLPSDLGGNLESIEALHKTHSERLLRMKEYFKDEENQENVSSEVLSEIRRVDFEGLSECISDHQLLLFFVAYKRDMEKTRNAIKNYFKYKKNFTHFFLNRDPKCDDIQQCLENQYNFFLPVTPLKMSVVYAAFRNSDPSKFFHDNAIKTYLMVIDACLNVHGPKNGLILLFDCKNSKIGHLKRVNKCLPVKLEEIHILNPPFYLETVLALCRPFMKHDRKLFVHTPTNDYSKLFNGKIPPDCLPSDFGGSLDSIEELHKKNTELLMKMRHYFTDEEKKLVALKRENVSLRTLSQLRESNPEGMPKCITDHQLLLFYCACNHDMDATQNTIKNYYKHKKDVPIFFHNRDPSCNFIQNCLDNLIFFYLPVTTNNMSVIYGGMRNPDPSVYFIDTAIKAFLMVIDSCLNAHGPRSGLIFIYDAKNVHYGHIRRMKLKSIKIFCNYVQESLPGKLAEIHIINAPFYFETIMALVRPFMKSDRNLFIHGPSNNYGKIFEGKIPLDCLPSELGGHLDSIEELHKRHSERLLKLKNYFIDEEKQFSIITSIHNEQSNF
uniref:CSON010066 protein n=1 Tax=Culicoides sonorensis TaxID=179676 RepID=A0A336M194_CULSO